MEVISQECPHDEKRLRFLLRAFMISPIVSSQDVHNRRPPLPSLPRRLELNS
jgi:hypothetical protein